MANWYQVVAIIQTAFRDGWIPAECACKTVFILPKGKGELRGRSIVKFIWNMVSIVVNLQIGTEVNFHDALHGFRAGRGEGTASLKAKLLYQLT